MKKEKIKTVDGQTLLDMRLPQIRFVVDGLLPQGLHILAGAAKTGKSWLLLLLSLRVAQGKPFWNLQTEKGTVLSLCLEDSLNRIQQRLMDLTEDAPENLHFATLSKSLSDGLCEQIEEFITEHPDTNLVIIDTLQKVRENSGESNLYATDYKDIWIVKISRRQIPYFCCGGTAFEKTVRQRSAQYGDRFDRTTRCGGRQRKSAAFLDGGQSL